MCVGMCSQVAGVGHQPAQLIGRRQRPLREGRHLHRVDVDVQQPGVGLAVAGHARSSTSSASSVSAPSAGSPVRRSHSCHGVRPTSASANSVATSGSSPNRA